MEARWLMGSLKRRDLILLTLFFLVATGGLLWFLFVYREAGNYVEITVRGESYGIYSLNEDREIPIITEEGESNHLVIADGAADMTWADCPDKICVHHMAVSQIGETIVCLPNQVVVTVVGEAGVP